MGTVANSFFIILASFSFAFAFWRRLKEDYQYSRIFKFTLIALVGSLLGEWAGYRWAPDYLFWTTALGAILASLYSIKKFSFKLYEVVDAAAIGFFWFLFFSNLALLSLSITFDLSALRSLKIPFIKLLLVLFSILLYRFFSTRYRKFSWYPSGRIGFVGLASLCIYLLAHSILSVFAIGETPSLQVEIVNVIIGVVLSGILAFTIYKRAGF